MTDQLPDKPSELLELALSDLAKVEASPEYETNMWGWHSPSYTGVCYVCMAASVMAKTLEVDRFKSFSPADFETDTQNKLFAIDNFRTGDLDLALETLGINRPHSLTDYIDVADYDDDPKQFKEDMSDIIKMLKREEL